MTTSTFEGSVGSGAGFSGVPARASVRMPEPKRLQR
jgi:hypothetical protein